MSVRLLCPPHPLPNPPTSCHRDPPDGEPLPLSSTKAQGTSWTLLKSSVLRLGRGWAIRDFRGGMKTRGQGWKFGWEA